MTREKGALVSRRLLTLFAILALALAALSPVGAAGAAEPDDIDFAFATPEVQKSTTGSYVVIMDQVPLLVTEGKGNLNTARALDKAQQMEAKTS